MAKMYVALCKVEFAGRRYAAGELSQATPPQIPRGPGWASFDPKDAHDLRRVESEHQMKRESGSCTWVFADAGGRRWHITTRPGNGSAQFEQEMPEVSAPEDEPAGGEYDGLAPASGRAHVGWVPRFHETKGPKQPGVSSTPPTTSTTPESTATREPEVVPDSTVDEPTYPTMSLPLVGATLRPVVQQGPEVSSDALMAEGYPGRPGATAEPVEVIEVAEPEPEPETAPELVPETSSADLLAEGFPTDDDGQEFDKDEDDTDEDDEDPGDTAASVAPGPSQSIEGPPVEEASPEVAPRATTGGRKCTVCCHPQRTEIDAALIAGTSVRAIASQYKLSRSAVHRHLSRDIPGQLAAARDAEEVSQLRDAAGILEELHTTKDRVIDAMIQIEALTPGDRLAALPALLQCVRSHVQVSELLLKVELAREAAAPEDTRTMPTLVVLPRELTGPEWVAMEKNRESGAPIAERKANEKAMIEGVYESSKAMVEAIITDGQ